MHICLDIDDTITYAPEFFAHLCNSFTNPSITIVSFRTDLEPTKLELAAIPIQYDSLVLSSDPIHGKAECESLHQWKANYVNRLKPDIFFEDMPEVVALIDPSIVVFMPCDNVIRSWIQSNV